MNINKCSICGNQPRLCSRVLDEDDIFDGIVCDKCETGAYSGDPLSASREEREYVIEEWNSLNKERED